MGAETNISWCDSSWNPIIGCTKCSMGCDACYAARDIHTRLRNHPNQKVSETFRGLTVQQDGRAPDWAGVRLLPYRLAIPRRWRKPKRIFVGSMTDIFHTEVSDEFLDALFTVMEDEADWHTYMILTKRAERMRAYLNKRWASCVIGPPNIEVGVTVEHEMYVGRITELQQTKAALRFVSMEPLLSAVNIAPYLATTCSSCGQALSVTDTAWRWSGAAWEHACVGESECAQALPRLHAVIVGGESGPHARRMDIMWANDIADACEAHGVALHFKQLGHVLAAEYGITGKGDDWAKWPASLDWLKVREWSAPTTIESCDALTRMQAESDNMTHIAEHVLNAYSAPHWRVI